jgi:hypothetical protein
VAAAAAEARHEGSEALEERDRFASDLALALQTSECAVAESRSRPPPLPLRRSSRWRVWRAPSWRRSSPSRSRPSSAPPRTGQRHHKNQNSRVPCRRSPRPHPRARRGSPGGPPQLSSRARPTCLVSHPPPRRAPRPYYPRRSRSHATRRRRGREEGASLQAAKSLSSLAALRLRQAAGAAALRFVAGGAPVGLVSPRRQARRSPPAGSEALSHCRLQGQAAGGARRRGGRLGRARHTAPLGLPGRRQRVLSKRRAQARGGSRDRRFGRAGGRTRTVRGASALAAHASRGRGVPVSSGTQRGKHARAQAQAHGKEEEGEEEGAWNGASSVEFGLARSFQGRGFER